MLLAIRIWLGKTFFGTVGDPSNPAGYRVGRHRFIKWPCQQSELDALRFIADSTTIPVPKVYRSHKYQRHLAVEMTYLRGCETLRKAWRSLSAEQKKHITRQIADAIEQLRMLRPFDDQQVSSTYGRPCRDIRVGTSKVFGPFKDVTAFHDFLRGGLSLEVSANSFGRQVVKVHERKYAINYTHGDLASLNILVRDGNLTAIIDWECAGWYPEYWEYTKAHYNCVYLPEFHDMLDQHLHRYDKELQAERVLWDRYDQFLDEVHCE